MSKRFDLFKQIADLRGLIRSRSLVILKIKIRKKEPCADRSMLSEFCFVIAGLDPAIHAPLQHGPPGQRRAKRRRSSERLCPVVTR
jgi:hypothetical protein